MLQLSDVLLLHPPNLSQELHVNSFFLEIRSQPKLTAEPPATSLKLLIDASSSVLLLSAKRKTQRTPIQEYELPPGQEDFESSEFILDQDAEYENALHGIFDKSYLPYPVSPHIKSAIAKVLYDTKLVPCIGTLN